MNSFNQTLRNFSIKIFVLLIGLIVSLCIPGILGAKLFGLYTLVVVWLGFLIPITSLGIGAGIVYYISNKSFSFQSVFSTHVFIAGMIGLINIVLLFIFKLSGISNHIDATLKLSGLLFLSISIMLQAFNFIFGRAYLGDSKFNNLNVLDLLSSILNPVLLLMVIWWIGFQETTFIYLSYLMTSLILFIGNCYFLRNQFNWDKLNMIYLKTTFQYGLKSWFGDIALRANLRIDQLILGSFVSLQALGVYGIAVKLVELIWLIPDTIGPVLFNIIAGKSDQETKLNLLARIHRLVFSTCFVLIIAWILICHTLIIPYILGGQYTEVTFLIILLAPGILILITSKIITKLFSGSGEVLWTSHITIFGSMVSIVCYVILIPAYGAIGAAIASTIGYFCLAMAGVYILKNNYLVDIKDYYSIHKADLVWIKERVINLLRKNPSI